MQIFSGRNIIIVPTDSFFVLLLIRSSLIMVFSVVLVYVFFAYSSFSTIIPLHTINKLWLINILSVLLDAGKSSLLSNCVYGYSNVSLKRDDRKKLHLCLTLFFMRASYTRRTPIYIFIYSKISFI